MTWQCSRRLTERVRTNYDDDDDYDDGYDDVCELLWVIKCVLNGFGYRTNICLVVAL